MKSLLFLACFVTSTTLIQSQSTPARISCNGQCVPYFQCRSSLNGANLIDISVRGPCDNYLDVCCEANNRITEPAPPATRAVGRQGCGYRNPEGVGFKTTGDVNNESKYGEFSWMVAILSKEPLAVNKESYLCGGSLIHPNVVLTAAHCVADKNVNQLRIRAGEWDTQTQSEIYPHQDRDVREVRVHDDYYSGGLFHDIAMIFVSTPFELAEHVGLICLPEVDENFDNSRCFSTGWGKDVYGQQGRYQVILKKVELPIVSRGKCVNALRNTRLGSDFELHNTFTCAGGDPNKDVCTGDGGSPLVCPLKRDPSRYVQTGIVAWGIGCGGSVPGVYANVAKLRFWVDEEMTYQGLDRKLYQP